MRAEAIQVLADRGMKRAVPAILRRLDLEQDEFVRTVTLRAEAAPGFSSVAVEAAARDAIAQLELTKGTLLQYFGVQIGDAGTGEGR